MLSFLFTIPASSHEFGELFTLPRGEDACIGGGYATMTLGSTTDFTIAQFRSRIECRYKNISSFLEFDAAPFLQTGKYKEEYLPNYLTQAWLGYQLSWNDAIVKLGRFQTAAGMAIPTPYNQILANEWHAISMFGHYGTGAFASFHNASWLLAFDVTGGTGYPFYDAKSNFSAEGGVESSELLRWTPFKEGKRDVLSLSLMNDSGSYIQGNGAYFVWSPTTKLDFYGGAFIKDSHLSAVKPEHATGIYVLGTVKVANVHEPFAKKPLDLSLHGAFDRMNSTTGLVKKYEAETVGLTATLQDVGRQSDSSITVDLSRETIDQRTGPRVDVRLRFFY